MIVCGHCSHEYPPGRFFFAINPLRLRCPECNTVLRAGPKTWRVLCLIGIPGALISGIFALYADYVLGWQNPLGWVTVIVGCITTGIITTWLVWRKGDYLPEEVTSLTPTQIAKMRRGHRIIIIALSLALLASLVLLGLTLWNNYWWKSEVSRYAESTGRLEAQALFRRGILWQYKIDGQCDEGRFSGEYDGPFAIWIVFYQPALGHAHHFATKRYVEAFNEQMRYMHEQQLRMKKRSDSAGNEDGEVLRKDGDNN